MIRMYDPPSDPSSRSISSLKTQLIPALKPFASSPTPLPVPIPTSPDDIQLYAEKERVEGDEDMELKLRVLDDEKKSLISYGLNKWPKVYVRWVNGEGRADCSFREDKGFSEPDYTLPRVDDEVPDTE